MSHNTVLQETDFAGVWLYIDVQSITGFLSKTLD